MADETKSVILRLSIDDVNSLKTINALKTAQSGFNKELQNADIGSDEYKKLQSNISLVKNKIDGLTTAQKQSNAQTNVQKGSLRDLQAQYNSLSKAIRDTAPGNQVLGKSFQDAQKEALGLKNQIKDFESSIGNHTPNVGNYTGAVDNLNSSMLNIIPGFSKISNGLNSTQSAFKGAQAGAETTKKSFISIAAVPIVAVLTAIVAVIGLMSQAIKSNDDLSTAWTGVMTGVGKVFQLILEPIVKLTATIFKLTGIIQSNANEAITWEDVWQGVIDFLKDQVEIRIKSLGKLLLGLGQILIGNTDGLQNLTDGFIGFNFGVENATDKIAAFGKEVAQAIKEGIAYEKALDAIQDSMRENSVAVSENEKAISQLLLASKDHAKEIGKRVALLDQASAVERKNTALQIKDQEDLVKLLSKERAARAAKGKVDDEFDQELADAKIKYNNLLQSGADLEEKISNRRNALLLEEEAKREKANAAIEKDNKERYDTEVKRLADLAALQKRDVSARLAAEALVNEEQIKFYQELENGRTVDFESRKKYLNDILNLQLKNLESQRQQELNNDQLTEGERILINEKFNDQKLDLLRANRQAQAQIQEQITAKEKDELQKRKQATQNNINAGVQAADLGISIVGNLTSADTNVRLERLKERQAAELKLAGNNAKLVASINAKYAKQADVVNKQQAHKANKIAQIQAGVNTAQAFTRTLAQFPFPLNIVFAGLTAAAGIAQIINIQTQDNKLAKGGIIGGKSHAQGGTVFTGTDGSRFEAERDELLVVVNKHDTKRLSTLSAINSVHGKPFFKHGGIVANGRKFADGGIVARAASESIQQDIRQRNIILDIIKSQPPSIVLVKDILTGTDRQNKVVSRADVL